MKMITFLRLLHTLAKVLCAMTFETSRSVLNDIFLAPECLFTSTRSTQIGVLLQRHAVRV